MARSSSIPAIILKFNPSSITKTVWFFHLLTPVNPDAAGAKTVLFNPGVAETGATVPPNGGIISRSS